MLIETILTKALAGAAGAMGARVFNSAKKSHQKGRKEALAAARSLTGRDIVLKTGVHKLETLVPKSVDQNALTIFLNKPDINAIARELFALRIAAADKSKIEQLREAFQSSMRSEFFDLELVDVNQTSNLIFHTLNDTCADIANILEKEHADTVMLIRQGAQNVLLQATLDNIDRHVNHLANPPSYSKKEGEDFIQNYRKQLVTAHGRIVPPDFDRQKKVPIDELYVSPSITTGTQTDALDKISIDGLQAKLDRTVLLGDPGGGKSTASTVITYRSALADTAPIPFLIVLRDFPIESANRSSIVDYIDSRLRGYYQLEPPSGAVERMLVNGDALVIFDGLDELIDTSQRREMTEIVELFCNRYALCKVLVTSRRVGYEQAPMDKEIFQVYEIEGFEENQIAEYAKKWFKQEALSDEEYDQITQSFIEESAVVPDLRTNPLMLSLMCIIYRGQSFIPRNRPEVYERCATMLFDKWDSSRHIHVKLQAGHVVDPVLKHIAYWMLTSTDVKDGVTESELARETSRYLLGRAFEDEDTARRAADEFVRFCRGRAWVFSDAGSTASGELLYKFTHRTFMEYFAAYQLTRKSNSPEALARVLLPRVARGEWDVVAQLAVQIENKNSENGADRVLECMLNERRTRAYDGRAAVLGFIARCLGFINAKPSIVRKLTSDTLELVSKSSKRDSSDIQLLGSLLSESIDARETISDEIVRFVDLTPTKPLSVLLNVWTIILMLPDSVSFYGHSSVSQEKIKYWTEKRRTLTHAHKSEVVKLSKHDFTLSQYCVNIGLQRIEEFIAQAEPEALTPLERIFTSKQTKIFAIRFVPLAYVISVQALHGWTRDDDGHWKKVAADLAKIIDENHTWPFVSARNLEVGFISYFDRSEEFVEPSGIDEWYTCAIIICVFAEGDSGRARGRDDLTNRILQQLGSIGSLALAREGKIAGQSIDFPDGLSSQRTEILRSWARGEVDFVRP